jgi:hypothetical protein
VEEHGAAVAVIAAEPKQSGAASEAMAGPYWKYGGGFLEVIWLSAQSQGMILG